MWSNKSFLVAEPVHRPLQYEAGMRSLLDEDEWEIHSHKWWVTDEDRALGTALTLQTVRGAFEIQHYDRIIVKPNRNEKRSGREMCLCYCVTGVM